MQVSESSENFTVPMVRNAGRCVSSINWLVNIVGANDITEAMEMAKQKALNDLPGWRIHGEPFRDTTSRPRR